MKRMIKILVVIITLQGFIGCNYLDIVPDNVATIENAFALRNQARKFLHTCYSYIPNDAGPHLAVAVTSRGEEHYPLGWFTNTGVTFAQGLQNVTSPLFNFWEGLNSGTDLYQGIRDCNIFLENIQNVPDMQQWERDQWAAEVKFLKAYYHFYLMQLYGPIPLIRENLPIDAGLDEVRVRREPVDICVDYIVELLDEALLYLPDVSQQEIERSNYGRITALIARGLKARVLTTAASPLFNGNSDYADYVDNVHGQLFNQTYSAEKWERAMRAAKEAIDNAEFLGMELFVYEIRGSLVLPDTFMYEMSIREAFSSAEAHTRGEVIWPNTTHNGEQVRYIPRSWDPNNRSTAMWGNWGPPISNVEMFYTDKGLPIDQDQTWNYNGRYDFRVGDGQNKHHIKLGYETVNLHFHREPRFYANIGFDGGVWYGQNRFAADGNNFYLDIRGLGFAGPTTAEYHSPTGYFPKKPVNYNTWVDNTTLRQTHYRFPNMRLTELYLMYIETANEFIGPNADGVLDYLNAIRERAGIPRVQESWDNYSNQQGKYNTKEGLREIIRQERRIELNQESRVYWDLLRWKMAEQLLNTPVMGWNKNGVSRDEFYQFRMIAERQFRKRDYFMPIRELELQRNGNLLQSPGW